MAGRWQEFCRSWRQLTPGCVNGQIFWGLMIALLCLFTMWFSGSNLSDCRALAGHLSANMDTLVALGTSAAWISSAILIINPDFIPGGGRHLYLDAAVLISLFFNSVKHSRQGQSAPPARRSDHW